MSRTLAIAVLVSAAMLAASGCCTVAPPPPIFACKVSTPVVFPKIAIDKTAPPTAEVGQEFDYVIRVTNPGTILTPRAILADVLPEGIQYLSSTPEAAVEGQTLRWNLGDLPVKDVKTVTVKVKALRTGRFLNVAAVTAETGLKRDAKAATVVVQGALSIQMSAPEESLICEAIPMKIVVSNTGDAPARNVKFTLAPPEGLAFRGEEGLQRDLGTIKNGATREIVVEAHAAKVGEFVTKAAATADGGLKADGEGKTAVRQPMLALAAKAPAMRYSGRDAACELTVTNQGDGPAKDVTLTYSVPEGTAFVEAGDGGKANGGKVVWTLGDLASKAEKTVTVKVRGTAIGTAVHTAKVTARCAEASAEAKTVIAGIPAILLENWDNPDPIEVGAQTTYTVRVTNQGSAEDKNIVVVCILPAEETLVSAEGPTPNTVDGQKVTFAPVKSLAPKEASTYKVVVKGVKAGDVRFKVLLTSDMMTTPAEKSESTHIYE